MRSWSCVVGVVVAVVGCAEQPQSPAVATPATPAAAPASAYDVLAAMAQAYANAPTYADHGSLATTYSGRVSDTTKLAFETAFVRDQRFRFAYTEDHEFRGKVLGTQRYVIWSDFAHTYSEWSVRPGIADDGPALATALAAAAGVSGGTSVQIPTLLMHDKVGVPTLAHLGAPSLDGAEVVDGHECLRVVGKRRGDPTTLWIDRDEHVIRRIQTSHHFPDFDTTSTYDLVPALGAPLDASTIAPPDIAATPPTPRGPARPLAWLGIQLDPSGATVRAILRGGPAGVAGMRAGDAIVALGGTPVSAGNVWRELFMAKVDVPLAITVQRGATQLELSVTPIVRPAPEVFARVQLVDKPAPVFDLPVVAGASATRATLARGRVTLVEFLSADSDACVRQVGALEALAGKHPGLQIIGVSSDDPDDLRTFARESHASYAIARDDAGRVQADYSSMGIPTLVLVDRAGVVRAVLPGGSESELEAALARLPP